MFFKGILRYNDITNEYGLFNPDIDDWEICGFDNNDRLEVWNEFKEEWIPTEIVKIKIICHLNTNDEIIGTESFWHLIGTNFFGSDLEGLKVIYKW